MAQPTPINTAKFAQAKKQPALKNYMRAIVLNGYQIGREKLLGDPAKQKLLDAAREHIEEVLGL